MSVIDIVQTVLLILLSIAVYKLDKDDIEQEKRIKDLEE